MLYLSIEAVDLPGYAALFGYGAIALAGAIAAFRRKKQENWQEED